MLGLGREHERVLLAAARFGAFLGLALGNVPRKHGDDTRTALMRCEHDPVSLLLTHAENRLEDRDDELPWRVIVVDKNNLMQARLLCFRLNLGTRFDKDIAHRPMLSLGT